MLWATKNLFYNSRSNTDQSEYNVRVADNTTERNAATSSKINLTENSDAASQSTEQPDKDLRDILGPFHYESPEGFKWVPNGWKTEPVTFGPSIANISFEDLFLEKLQSTGTKKNAPRSKLDFRTKVSFHDLHFLPILYLLWFAQIHLFYINEFSCKSTLIAAFV